MSKLSAPDVHDLHDDFDDFHDEFHDDLRDDVDDLREEEGPAADRDGVEVRRNAPLAAAVAVVAGAVSLAYLARALGDGAWLDWAVAVAMGLLAAAYLSVLLDSRLPLLVADRQGVRLRLGHTWRGVPWSELEVLEHQPRRGLLRDGRLVLVLDDEGAVLGGLDGSGRRQVALAQRLYGSPLAIPLGMSTRVVGDGGDLTATLVGLAGGPERVVEVAPVEDWSDDEPELGPEPELDETVDEADDEPIDEPIEDHEDVREASPVRHDPRLALARSIDYLAGRWRRPPAEESFADPLVASATPAPLRDPVVGTRAELHVEPVVEHPPVGDETAAWTPSWEDSWESEADHEPDHEPDHEAGAPDASLEPVIGPQLAAARSRLALSVDQLAERTRIRPHVIESIEVDDFAPCGGDFYARGHLRTLARVLGVEAAPLVAAYDERYADAPIDARRVFEADLATGPDGPIRSTRGGPNWSVLVAAVMALVLAWSIARLIMDSPVSLDSKPVLNGSPSQAAKPAAPVPVLLDAAGGGAHVVVRDAAGEVVFNGDLAYGQKKSVKASPPVQVQSSDGGLQVSVAGTKRGPIGAEGQPASSTYAASR